MVNIFPKGSVLPKYFAAILSVITILFGFVRAVLLSPLRKGIVKMSNMLESALIIFVSRKFLSL